MGSSRDDKPEYTAVVCPTCATRIYPEVQEQASEAECPDCFTMVHVPALESVLADRPAAQVLPDVGTYDISAQPEEPRRRAKAAEPDYVKIVCPHCACLLHPDLKDKPQHITCPDCLQIIDVPSHEDAKKQRQRRRRKKRPPTPGTYAVPGADSATDSAPPRSTTFETNLHDAQAEIRREAPPPIPKWTFFTGVFGFPWRSAIVMRWACLSLGLTALGGVASLLLYALAEMVMAIPFFALPAIWIAFLSFSYASACWSAVLEDTAAGNDEIHNWLDANWREWFAKMIYLAFIGVVASFAAWGVGLLGRSAAGHLGFWLTFGGMMFFVYPVVLLSSLEANSPWVPLTRPVVASVAKFWWAWLAYFSLSAILAAAYLVPMILGVQYVSTVLTLLLTGPVLAAVILIHARLLGRLAWRAIVRPSEEAAGSGTAWANET